VISSADARLYASAIAIVSGIYSIAAALVDSMGPVPISDTVMLVLGIVVLVHGIALLTPIADRLGSASGALMLVWAAIMLGNQALAAASASAPMMNGMAWDGGMVAIAVLMLASGLIMFRGREM
jgi:hypothetical protein